METGNAPEKDFLKLELGNIEDDDSGTAGNAGFFFYSFPVWYLKRRGVRNEQRGNFKSIFVYMKDLLPDLVGATNAIAFCFYKVEFLISNFIFVCCVAIYLSNMHDFIFIEPFQYARLYIHRTYWICFNKTFCNEPFQYVTVHLSDFAGSRVPHIEGWAEQR